MDTNARLPACPTIIETKQVRAALKLAEIVLASETSKIGEITGPPGIGKSMAGRWISQQMHGVRIACWDGMTRFQLARSIASAVGIQGAGAVERLLAGEGGATGRSPLLLVIDEAQKLTWHPLEMLRYLIDECCFSALLIGTELFERQFTHARTRELLLQLGSRIGPKRIKLSALDRSELYSHVLRPRLGEVGDKELITRFWIGARRGIFREAVELAEECRRVMDANGYASLTPAALDVALTWMANRREGDHGE